MANFKGLIFRLGLMLIAAAHFLYSVSPEDWQKNKEAHSKLIRGKIITRVIRLANTNTHQCQAIGVIYAPIEKIWGVISDYNHFKDFMPSISESFVINPSELKKISNIKVNDWPNFEKDLRNYKLEQIRGNLIYFYNRFNLPWPLQDRYYILKMVQSPEKFTFRWTQLIGNTKVIDGSWELLPYQGSKRKTLGIYTLITDPGISIPPSLVRLGMKITLPGTIKSVRKRILKLFLEERENARTQSLGDS